MANKLTFNVLSGEFDLVGTGTGTIVTTAHIPELSADPVSPANGDAWVLASQKKGSPIGLLLALTYPVSVYKLSYKTIADGIKRVTLLP